MSNPHGLQQKDRYLTHTARHLGTHEVDETDRRNLVDVKRRDTMALPAAEGRLVPSDGYDPRESASRRVAANAVATARDVGNARRRRPGDDQAIPPETGGDDDKTNNSGRRVAAPRRDGGNRLARGRLANPRDVATP